MLLETITFTYNLLDLHHVYGTTIMYLSSFYIGVSKFLLKCGVPITFKILVLYSKTNVEALKKNHNIQFGALGKNFP